MMGKAHLKVLEQAAESARGYYGDLILEQRYWIDRSTAGRFNDGVLRDWYYKKTPQTIWCVRRLTRAIDEAPADDRLLTAFLLHWTSHYFVDALWACHVAQRYMEEASAAEKKEFDNGIEREVEEIVGGPAFTAPGWERAGYWTHFWRGRIESDRLSLPLIEAWERKSGYIPISLESVPACVASFTAFLRYLNERREYRLSSSEQQPANAWVVGLDQALEQGRPVGEVTGESTNGSAGDGWRTDLWLDQTGAAFGTGTPQLATWPGEWVLAQRFTGQQLAERVFTPEFAAELTKFRGYERAEPEQEPEKAAPHAIEDRDRQLALMAVWLERWDVATGNPNATAGAKPTALPTA